MKFRFCGDADCPDWLLMQIHTLSNLSEENLQKLCEEVKQSLMGRELNYEKVKEATREARLDTADTKACVAAVELILRSSVCHGVGREEVSLELEQLGLEAGQAGVVAASLDPSLAAPPFRLPRPKAVSTTVAPDSRVNLSLTLDDGTARTIVANKDQIALLLEDLKEVRERMKELQPV